MVATIGATFLMLASVVSLLTTSPRRIDVDQARLAKEISAGSTVRTRHQAVLAALDIEPSERGEVLWRALSKELVAVGAARDRRDRQSRKGAPLEPDDDEALEHLWDLVKAVSQWTDVRALPPLIGAVDWALADAIVPVVRFGSRAVGPLLQAIHQAHPEQAHTGMFLALRILVEGTRGSDNLSNWPLFEPVALSEHEHELFVDMVRHRLRPGHAYIVDVIDLSCMALLTGDAGLRRDVERLAQSRTAVQAYAASGNQDQLGVVQFVQNGIRRELLTHTPR
jgi:hypothetical protein